jgi:UDP-2,3-diacylglucosamine pyrophosphatase LpxH
MTRFEIEKSEATKYEVATKDPLTGKVRTTELHRVFVRLRPKAGPSVIDVVTELIDAAFEKRRPLHRGAVKANTSNVMQCVVISDPHIGKYAWRHETGWDDYDIGIASRMLRTATDELLRDGDSKKIATRTIVLLGDYFHYDTPHGQTTSGTALDRDGRVEKMMNEGARVLFDVIEASASIPTRVVLVPGNHDTILTIALRQLVAAQFRNDKRIVVESSGTTRKYMTHGRCLIGFTHGDKARKRLGELMALEAREAWGATSYREIHTGHLHAIAEVETISGVVVRTHPALCPPDGWHATEGFVGATRGMQSFYYHAAGGLIGMTMSNPDMGRINAK